jgi:NitT/TauT family transport system substrate-binding protein
MPRPTRHAPSAMAIVAACITLLATALLPSPGHARTHVTYLLPAAIDQPAFAPWIIAKQLRYYTDAGYDVAFAPARGGIDVARQIGIGRAAIGGALGDTPIIVRGAGVRVKAIAVLGGGSLTTIVAGRDRGIHALRDLRGRHVLVLSLEDTTYHVLLGALAAVGLRDRDVRIEAAGPETIVQRVVAGSADACACVPDWQVAIRNAQPGAVVLPTNEVFPSMAQAILASDRAIATQPEMLHAVVAATLRGMRFIMDDPHKAADVYEQAMPGMRGRRNVLEQIFRAYIEQTYSGQATAGLIDAWRLDALQNFYRLQGFIQHAVPVAELYTNEFVPAHNP